MGNDERLGAAEVRIPLPIKAEWRPPGTRAEHLAWCKERALKYVEAGELNEAFASMGSDLGKHPETANHAGIMLGAMLLMGGRLSTTAEMRKFIEGFN